MITSVIVKIKIYGLLKREQKFLWMNKRYVAVRAAYYKHDKITKKLKKFQLVDTRQSDGTVASEKKSQYTERSYKSAKAEFEHVLRTGRTNSANVFDKYTSNNVTFSPPDSVTPLDAYYKCLDKYKETTGRKCRSDMNTLFEHVVVLSEQHVRWLERKLGEERAKQAIVKCLKSYAKTYSDKYGFTELGGVLHLDEGSHDQNGNFVRNVHAHLMFFNYDFNTKKSNLRNLCKKGIAPDTGKTNTLNENFVDTQEIAYQCFMPLKFQRGRSSLQTLRKYLPKHKFVLQKLKQSREQYLALSEKIKVKKAELAEYFEKWLLKLTTNEDAKVEANIVSELILDIVDKKTKSLVINKIEEIENKVQGKTIAQEESIAKQIKIKSRRR